MDTAAKYRTEIQGPIGSHTVIVTKASDNFLAVEFWCKPWGTLSNDAVWVAYTLNGKLCLGSLEHFYAGKVEAIEVALKAIDDKDGGVRVYLSHFLILIRSMMPKATSAFSTTTNIALC